MNPQDVDKILHLLLVEQAEQALVILEQSERIHALECALALDRRAIGILEMRRAEAHEANREKRDEWNGKLQVLKSPAPSSMKIVN